MALRELVLDAWASLTFKEALQQPDRQAATWVPQPDRRRLAAYRLLHAYVANAAREFLRTQDEGERASHREYGDADLLVSRVVSGVLGDEMAIVVDGAERDLPEQPPLPDAPEDPSEEATPIELAAFEAQQRVWEMRARDAIEEWESAWTGQPALRDRQAWLRQWADDEMLDQRVWECEQNAASLGDGVYVLGWSGIAGRPRLQVYDPGFYFPVLDGDEERYGYPRTVHLAWEEDRDGDGTADHVRRLTWRLGPIAPAIDEDLRGVLTVRVDEDGRPVLRDGDRFDRDGRIVRRYPWAPDEDSDVTCYLTDATWRLADLNATALTDLRADAAFYALNEDGDLVRDLDLRIDFIPVVHVPNTPASQDHFGKSVLARVLQLLDDIAGTDSDLQAAAALAGTPMVGFSGDSVPDTVVVAPGTAFGLGANGRMDVLDLSASVTALREVVEDLLERFSVNSQVSAEILGRVAPGGGDAPSGISREYATGPYRALIGMLRLVRDQKYRLLLKFVQRLAQAGGALEPGVNPTARLAFGSYLPSDLRQMVELVVELLEAKAISRTTALRLLVDIGIDVGDLAEELARIEAEDLEGAVQLADATGDDDAVRRRLRLAGESPLQEEPPVIDLPAR